MFQRLTKMFESYSDVSIKEPKFSTVDDDDDDDWVLVDVIADSCTKYSDSEDDDDAATFQEISPVLERPRMAYELVCLEWLRNPPDLSKYSAHPLEESWFVTPPPCFTAGELTTKEVETSPFENILIEHPSMSVYAVHNLLRKGRVDDVALQSSAFLGVDLQNEKLSQRVVCPVAALKARIRILEQTKNYRCNKSSKQQFERRLMNRNGFRRQNLIRNCQTKHRGLPVHQPCQRRYNY
ncbi:tumor protein p53-inducible nuclear protein 1 isoform 1-T2 [Discoglossus pictus]